MNCSIDEKSALRLASIQASIFESCVDSDVDELEFVSRFMKSPYPKTMDDGTYFICYEDRASISSSILGMCKQGKHRNYESERMRFAGYFYRYYCTLRSVPSLLAWKKIPFSYLIENYDVLHSMDVKKACEVADEANRTPSRKQLS